MFSAQVIDDRLENEQPDQENALENQGEGTEPKDKEHNFIEGQNEQYEQENYPDGSQYEAKELSYEEYDGYTQPSDEDELVYIQAMRENEASTSWLSPRLKAWFGTCIKFARWALARLPWS